MKNPSPSRPGDEDCSPGQRSRDGDIRSKFLTPQLQHKGYLPLSEAAAWAGVSERTLKRWISRGLPTFQAGPREKVLIRPADIDQFLIRQQAPKPDLDTMVDEVLRSFQIKA
jgi:hypothetical protein